MIPHITDIFRFKKFTISQTLEVFRVNTEAVLLAAWVEPLRNKTILDIGSGTGVIGLALDFHFDHSNDIIAIDMDSNAYHLTQYNITQNNTTTIHAQHIGLNDFVKKSSPKYDVIVSNPPFFHEGFKSIKQRNQLAKYTDSLSFEDLIAGVDLLLDSEGIFYVVIPTDRVGEILLIASRHHLYLVARRTIVPRRGMNSNRELLKFSRKQEDTKHDILYIRNEDNQYSNQYIAMTRAFYTIFD